MEGPESAKDALEVDYLDKKQKGHWIVVIEIKMSFPEKESNQWSGFHLSMPLTFVKTKDGGI